MKILVITGPPYSGKRNGALDGKSERHATKAISRGGTVYI